MPNETRQPQRTMVTEWHYNMGLICNGCSIERLTCGGPDAVRQDYPAADHYEAVAGSVAAAAAAHQSGEQGQLGRHPGAEVDVPHC